MTLRRRSPGGRLRVAAGLTCVLAACGPPPNEHPPDQLLRDSLGLEESDQVFRVEVTAEQNRERPSPAEVRIPPGAFVEFVTRDRRLHTIAFEVDGMPAAARDFLRTTDQLASPPLVELDSRFVVSFRDAPAGRYPYVLQGNGEAGRGVVIVQEPTG